MINEKFLTTEQIANILQVHPFTILKFIKQGKLKGIKIGRMYRIQESEVQRFIEERMTQPSASKKKENIEKKSEVQPQPMSDSKPETPVNELETTDTAQEHPPASEKKFDLTTSQSSNNNGGQYYII